MPQQATECPQSEAQMFTKQKQYRFCLKNTLPDHGYICRGRHRRMILNRKQVAYGADFPKSFSRQTKAFKIRPCFAIANGFV